MTTLPIQHQSMYDDAHVHICNLLARQYNNPLGDQTFPTLLRLLAPKKLRVLDAGCGRGRSSLWWARNTNALVHGFDPSEAMLLEANRLVLESGVQSRVQLTHAHITSYSSPHQFDLILAHDVLCYSHDRIQDLAKLTSWADPGCILSISDYYGEANHDMVSSLAHSWQIAPPISFSEYAQLLTRQYGLELLLHYDTTSDYADHWRAIRQRLEENRVVLEAHVGAWNVTEFEQKIDRIEDAVQTGCFGHFWAIAEYHGPSNQERVAS